MASRKDYAQNKRGKASASRAQSAPRKKVVKKRFPTVLLAVTLLLLGGLGFGLYKLTQVEPEKVRQAAIPEPAPKKPVVPAKAVKEKSAPVATTEAATDKKRFEFYQMLKESEVNTSEVDVYKSTPKDAKTEHSYLLQAGSFRSKTDAERMRAQLILLGLPNVHTDTSKSSDGSLWYRVRLGPFDNRSRLSKAYDKLVQQNIQPLRIKQ